MTPRIAELQHRIRVTGPALLIDAALLISLIVSTLALAAVLYVIVDAIRTGTPLDIYIANLVVPPPADQQLPTI